MPVAEQFSRLFTIEEANSLLPVVRPLVKQTLEKLEFLKDESEVVIHSQGLAPDSPDLMARLQESDAIARAIEEIRELAEQINSHGCICKGVEEGLVDFPCLYSGEIVFLCWQYGEESLTHWHRIEDGYAGRKPLLDPSTSDGNVSYH